MSAVFAPPDPETPLLSAESIAAILRPLRRDYARAILRDRRSSAGEQRALVDERIAVYSDAFSDLFGGALDDAAEVR